MHRKFTVNCIKIQSAEPQEDIQDTDKLHTRTLKKRTNQSSPLQGEIEGVGNFKNTMLYIMEPLSRLP